MKKMPAFLVTIDTEGDNIWASPREITTRNAAYLSRFQGLCERYGLKPTYLVTYEMARCPAFVSFGRDILKRKAGEMGMHLHAWNTPPLEPLTEDDFTYKPYLIDFPTRLIREKIATMTRLLEDTFEIAPRSHRAGRWAFNWEYAKALIQEGYQVDCSVTPHVNWSFQRGDPRGQGGTNYRGFPETPYFLGSKRIDRPGNSPLLEVPVTIRSCPVLVERALFSLVKQVPRVDRALRRLWPIEWLRPNGENIKSMLHLVDAAARSDEYVEFMLHSSELMPGGSRRFKTQRSVDVLYDHLEILFARSIRKFRGETLIEFRSRYLR